MNSRGSHALDTAALWVLIALIPACRDDPSKQGGEARSSESATAMASESPAPRVPDPATSSRTAPVNEAASWGALQVRCDSEAGRLLLYEPDIVNGVRKAGTGGAPEPLLANAIGGRSHRPGAGPFDCRVGKHSLRIELGMSNPMPYGQCGADPERWISVWVDRVKVLSARVYAGRCHPTPLAQATIGPTGIDWCRAGADTVGIVRDPSVKCERTSWNTSARTVDTREYPPAGVERPRAGDVVVEHAELRELCEALIAPRKERLRGELPVRPPPGSEIALTESESDTCSTDFGRFDLDNDGRADRVYRRRCMGGYHDGNEYFLLPPDFSETGLDCGENYGLCPDNESELTKTLRRASRLTIPAAWKNTKNEDPQYRLRHQAEPDRASEHPAPGKRHYIVRLRYLHLTPFRHDGATYLASSPPDHAYTTEDTFFVLRPNSKRAPDEVCVFHQVQQNF